MGGEGGAREGDAARRREQDLARERERRQPEEREQRRRDEAERQRQAVLREEAAQERLQQIRRRQEEDGQG